MRKSCNSAMHSTPEKPPPGDHERQQPLPFLRIVGNRGFLQHVDRVIAQPQRVAQVLERDRVLFETGHHAAGQSRAKRNTK